MSLYKIYAIDSIRYEKFGFFMVKRCEYVKKFEAASYERDICVKTCSAQLKFELQLHFRMVISGFF